MTPALELQGLHAGYGAGDVLHGIDLVVWPGDVYVIVGPNGAGKSTTLKVCIGQLEPSSGQVRVGGIDVAGTRVDELARDGVCLVPEGAAVFRTLTVDDNLRMFTHTGSSMSDVRAAAYEQFPWLRDRRKQLAGSLSGGEQRMLALVRAIGTNPRLLLLDEPTVGLATERVAQLYDHVAKRSRQGMSTIIAEQHLPPSLGDNVNLAFVSDGCIVSDATTTQP